jgi:hypothetical protein
MIDEQTFGGWLGVLADRFGRPLSPPSVRAYHTILSAAMTTAQFERAAGIVLSTFDYRGSWPAPAVFIEAQRPTTAPELDAAETLRAVRSLIRVEGTAYVVVPRYYELPEYVRRAVDAVGGWRRVHDATVDEEPFLLRDFAKHLAAAKDHAERSELAGVLPSGADPRVRQLVSGVAGLLSGPRTMTGEPIVPAEATPEERAELEAAAAWGAAHPNAEKVIRARLRRDAPKAGGVDEGDEGFRLMFEAARLRAYREAMKHAAQQSPKDAPALVSAGETHATD